MTGISRLVAEFKEDVNKDESMVLDIYSRFLSSLFKLILWLGIPFIAYIMIQFIGLI
ncbi:hypothetical protein ACFYKT_05510 [Cytobacillus sp. FJAT-53684]|uniref:Uncharacterized protein n=1 Tax=Cytobacillus mangrovibacter TaxID=3299024 RepID=A0ABW6JYI5_9BACI